MPVAEGNFDIRLTPHGMHDDAPSGLGRMSIDKDFRGDLVGTSRGEMLAATDAASGAAAYVAIERVAGVLDGRKGEFWLAHKGTMYDEHTTLEVTVVPGSATDELAGLSGSMTIDPAADHAYSFQYQLP